MRAQFQRLNRTCAAFRDGQFVMYCLRAQIKRRGLQFWELLAPQIAHLDVKARVKSAIVPCASSLIFKIPDVTGEPTSSKNFLSRDSLIESSRRLFRWTGTPCTRAEISPHEWNGSGRPKFRRPLIG
jgi:hypothetical protein